MSVPTFIVGTGRCGSTMLSNMLREHPHVLSLSECYAFVCDGGARVPETFSAELMNGPRFWALIAGIKPFVSFLLRHRIAPSEAIYPYDAPAARFSSQTGVPAILLATLPHLTDDHDALFDILEAEVNKWPTATLGAHYKRLFDWLAAHFAKLLWVERSGGGLMMAELILTTFPDARFIHIVRDGRDTAISMQEHVGFRAFLVMSSIGQFLGVDPIYSSDRTYIDRVPVELRPYLPEHFDADAFRAFHVPLPFCAENWALQIETGIKILRSIPADRILTLRYEDFFVDPKKQLDTFAAFLGENFVDEAWSTRCAAAVHRPRSSWRDLPAEEARELTKACQPGFELLAGAGVEYDF